ncbi:divergent polysaccharide deacetylase family protein [Sinimarinibacterium thermocellulolyticum]|uniref:Divergent polysaccharide deacetylase family protein n=1 Tax=Sinimarinibacterium thermocellulolyticum TaxID=3170016 RepID=A0ABV2A6L8_9GAMM
MISIVIDDLGDRWEQDRRVVELPGAVACAFLPESPHTPRLAALAHAAGKEILVHLPMEPETGSGHPLAIRVGETAEVRSRRIARLLESVPYATGVNNHQGSRATASRGTMHAVMRQLSLHGTRFFVDSMTSRHSLAYPLARAYGIPATRRHVFLDHERGAEAVRAQFARLIALARRSGGALAIGHPYPETIEVLEQTLPQLARLGVELVRPSELIRRLEREPPVLPLQLRISTALTSIHSAGGDLQRRSALNNRPSAAAARPQLSSGAPAISGPLPAR